MTPRGYHWGNSSGWCVLLIIICCVHALFREQVVQNRVGITGLKLLSMDKPCFASPPELVSVNLDSRRAVVTPRTDKSGSPSLLFVQAMQIMLNFLLRVWNLATS